MTRLTPQQTLGGKMQLSFATPIALILLIAIPSLYIYLNRKHKKIALFLPTLSIYTKSFRFRDKLPVITIETLRWLGIVFMIIALARPQLGSKQIERLNDGIDIVLTIDASGSMQALDFIEDNERIDRLTIVKKVAAEFVDNRRFDRIGLVIFGSYAFTQCPPTLDYKVLKEFMNNCIIGMAGRETAIGSAMAIGIKRLEKSKAKSKVLIMLTDGENTAGEFDPLQTAQKAAALGIRIYTIGVGSNEPVPFPQQGFFGKKIVYREMRLDEDTLKEIASITNGAYFNAQDTQGLRDVYRQIDQLEKSEVKVKEYQHYTDIFPQFLWPAFIVLGLVILLGQTIFRRVL